MAWCLHIYFRMISVPDGPLLSSGLFCGRLWPAPGLSICNSDRWSAECSLLPTAAQGFLQIPIWEPPLRVLPSPWGCRLSWDWVVNAINGEDNRGQGIDCKTWNVVLLETEAERLALEILLVCGDWEWPWGMIFTSEPHGVAPMRFWMLLTSLLGPRISDVLVFTRPRSRQNKQ